MCGCVGGGPPLIIEAHSAQRFSEKKRLSEEEIPVPVSPGRTAHPPPLIILPTAGIPSSSSHSRLKPMLEYGSRGHFGRETGRVVEEEEGGERRTWPTPAVVMAMCLCGRLSERQLPDSPPSLLFTHTHSIFSPSSSPSSSLSSGVVIQFSLKEINI